MRTLPKIYMTLLLLVGCGGEPEQLQQKEGAFDLTSSFHVGTKTQSEGTVSHIGVVTHRIAMPFAPSNPSGYSAFSTTWKVGNGDSVHPNYMIFRTYLVNDPNAAANHNAGAYYVATVDVAQQVADGHIVVTPNIVSFTAWPRYYFEFDWAGSEITIFVMDLGFNIIDYRSSSSVPFTYGTKPYIAYSPEVDFTMELGLPHDCGGDIPDYDDGPPNFNAHLNIVANYGVSSANILAPMATPLSSSNCALTVTNYSTNDAVTWHPEN